MFLFLFFHFPGHLPWGHVFSVFHYILGASGKDGAEPPRFAVALCITFIGVSTFRVSFVPDSDSDLDVVTADFWGAEDCSCMSACSFAWTAALFSCILAIVSCVSCPCFHAISLSAALAGVSSSRLSNRVTGSSAPNCHNWTASVLREILSIGKTSPLLTTISMYCSISSRFSLTNSTAPCSPKILTVWVSV